MARNLRADLVKKLGLSKSQVDRRIAQRENDRLLTRRLAMLSLARDAGLRLRHYATNDEMAALRGQDRAENVSAAAVPAQAKAPAAPARAMRTALARTTSRERPVVARPKPKDPRKVFVVHGRNRAIAKALFSFLRAVGLDPIEWSKAKQLTKKAQPSIPEILDAAFREAAAVVVLLTPDDLVVLKPRLQKSNDPHYEKTQTGQARPNVLFEAGLAFGLHPEATVLVKVGEVKPFTDVSGLYITRLDNNPESRTELVDSLRLAGAAVDTDGKTHWYREGNFEIEEK